MVTENMLVDDMQSDKTGHQPHSCITAGQSHDKRLSNCHSNQPLQPHIKYISSSCLAAI